MQNTHPTQPLPRSQTPPVFWGILCATVVLALLPTLWISLDLRGAAFFIGPDAHSDVATWWWVELINLYVPAVFRTTVLLALLGWLWASLRRSAHHWRLPLAFMVLAGALGPGLLVNSGFKDHWQRARPYQVEPFGGTQQFTRATVMTDQCNNNCSFVSGHVACGFFLASLMLVHRRRRIVWGITGVVSGLVIGFARMADGAHWLSDVLWAGPITLLCSWIVWKLLLRVYPA
jgi:lipid A 4'-phosphatase